MPGVELSTSARDGHVVVALRGDLDITGAADTGAAITALVAPDRCLIIDMSALDRAAFAALKEKFGKRGDHWIAKRDPADSDFI